jgi:hypothetical protein
MLASSVRGLQIEKKVRGCVKVDDGGRVEEPCEVVDGKSDVRSRPRREPGTRPDDLLVPHDAGVVRGERLPLASRDMRA